MSFKRAGDDHCALRLQKKRRVTDLLAEDIPADEASQTRSGRCVCLVCPHNPVLDTMAMLTLHRQGKKHSANMAIKIEKDHDLSELFQKRNQEMCLRQRAVSSASVFGNNHTLQVAENTCEDRPLLERTRQLTEAIRDKNQAKTYNRSGAKTLDDQLSSRKQRKNKPFFQSRVELHLSEKIDKTSRGNGKATCTNLSNTAHSLQDICPQKSSLKLQENKPTTRLGEVEKNKVIGNSLKGEETMEQQRYLELKKAGWILDLDGKWVKDKNVEFDSDEEDPP